MSDLEARIAEVIALHKPSRWRSFTNENEILRCCQQDFGNLTKKAKRDDDAKAWAAYAAHLSAMLAPAVRERESEAWTVGLEDGSKYGYRDYEYERGYVDTNPEPANPFQEQR